MTKTERMACGCEEVTEGGAIGKIVDLCEAHTKAFKAESAALIEQRDQAIKERDSDRAQLAYIEPRHTRVCDERTQLLEQRDRMREALTRLVEAVSDGRTISVGQMANIIDDARTAVASSGERGK